MVEAEQRNSSQVVNVESKNNTNSVSGVNDLCKYYEELAHEHELKAKQYQEMANTSASNALESATSADNSADICTGILENSHFQTVYTDLESGNSNIEAVGESISDVNTVASIATDISTLADEDNLEIIGIVADEDNLASINAVANDLTNIDNASANATLSKQYAIGEPTEPSEGSAKYWATQAATGQLQADWTQSDNTKKDYIKNKPNLATVATSGSYNDLLNKPTIPNAQIQADWLQSDNTQVDFIKNKPTIPTVPTNLSSFNDDLGTSPTHTHSQYLTQHQDISGKEDINKPMITLDTSGTITLSDNSRNTITPTGNITFTLPTVTDLTVFHEILVQINLTSVVTFDLGLGITPLYFNGNVPDLSSIGVYDLIYEYDNDNDCWVCGVVTKEVVS